MLVPAGLLFSACQGRGPEKEQEAVAKEPADCKDLTGVSEQDLTLRKKLAYVSESPIQDNQCNNCNLYLPPTADKKCGGCMLFKGPVEAEGYCTYWAPKV